MSFAMYALLRNPIDNIKALNEHVTISNNYQYYTVDNIPHNAIQYRTPTTDHVEVAGEEADHAIRYH